MKVCTKCKQSKDISSFIKDKHSKDGVRSECGDCSRLMKRESYKRNHCQQLFRNAKKRAKDKGYVFSITKEDIIIPDVCPLLGIKIMIANGRANDNSPSVDRIIPDKGYTKENIQIVSQRANRIKDNASLEELETIAENLRKIISNN